MAIGLREIEGRGRGMVALKPLRAGEVVLTDSPIIVYSAASLGPNYSTYCSNCFRILNNPSSAAPVGQVKVVSCSSCSSLFCSPECRSVAYSTTHTPWVCQALTRLRQIQYPLDQQDLQLQASFLVSAYNLSSISPSTFQTLLSLQGSATTEDASLLYLHSLISSIPPPAAGFQFQISLELTATLLAKDQLNAFGLMEPFREDQDGHRSVRAYAIYPVASFFNHDCLPNACRFDYVDQQHSTTNNTDIIVRMIHDVPQGREICLSYFPVNLKYSERQTRLKDDYGFTCDCDRCKAEANWSEEEDEEDLDLDDKDSNDNEQMSIMDEDISDMLGLESENAAADMLTNKGEDDFPHAYFFLSYMCDRNNCWGTLAPLPPSQGSTPTILECNVCGVLKNELSLS